MPVSVQDRRSTKSNECPRESLVLTVAIFENRDNPTVPINGEHESYYMKKGEIYWLTRKQADKRNALGGLGCCTISSKVYRVAHLVSPINLTVQREWQARS